MRFKYIYILYHSRIVDFDNEGAPIVDRKDLGCYLKKSKALEAVERYKRLPGFCEYPEDFEIDKRRIYFDGKDNGNIEFDQVYMVEHEFEDESNNCEVVTRIGVYADKKDAINEKEELMSKPPFSRHPNGFVIYEEILDEDAIIWNEGFDVE